MKIRIGYELIYDCPQPTPMILTLSVHYTRVSDIIIPDHLIAEPPVPLTAYRDSFGNWCSRIVAPQGQLRLFTDALVKDTGRPDLVVPQARQTPVDELPDDTLMFLLGSRYCETDLLSQTAWQPIRPIAHGMEPRPGHLRFRASPYHIWLRACPRHEDGLGRVPGKDRRLPRFHAPRRSLLSLHEYPRALLHGLPGRHRRAAE